jgi:CRP-like cAMP-binding protein
MGNFNEILSLDSEVKSKHIKKGEILQKSGALIPFAFFVKKGLLRSYAIDDKGKEHIFMFGSEGWTVGDNVAPGEKGELFIEALEDSVIVPISKSSPPKSNLPKLHKRIGVLQKRIIMLMSASAIERYNHFLEIYPDIVQRVPQKMIASYLGITPQALSTMRGKIAKGK